MYRIRRIERRTTQPHRQAGFTLLEVLLTAILSATLMAGLWTLFGTYLRLFETGQARVERSGLLRALASQFTLDLQSVVPPPVTSDGKPATTATSVAGKSESSFLAQSSTDAQQAELRSPQFRLAGNAHILRLEVLQSAPSFPTGETTRQDASGFGVAAEPRATQLRTIVYSFEPPREIAASDRDPVPGLLRRELTWEETRGNAQNKGAASSASQSAELSEFAEGFKPITPTDFLEESESANAAIWTPEVVAFRFRYYDGHTWHEEWDSRAQKALPAAVEIAYRLESIDDTRAAGAISDRLSASTALPKTDAKGVAGDETETASQPDDSLTSLDFDKGADSESTGEEGHLPVIRQIVSLSLATKSSGSSDLQSDDAFTPTVSDSSGQQEARQP